MFRRLRGRSRRRMAMGLRMALRLANRSPPRRPRAHLGVPVPLTLAGSMCSSALHVVRRNRAWRSRRGLCLAAQRSMGTARTNRTAGIDVLELLTSQHREVDALIEQLEQRKGDMRAAFNELA